MNEINLFNSVKKKIEDIFSIDLRTLVFFRISLSTVLLYDLFRRSFDLLAHYTDQGIIPRSALLESRYYGHFWSVYFIEGSFWFAALLFLINAGVLIFIFLGYRTRLSTVIGWILLVSLHNRNPLILTGGDTILRLFLFWSIFLPLGAAWSLDARRYKIENLAATKYFSLGTVALCLQFLMIYFFAWVSKTGSEWWPDGSAVYYALSIEYMTTSFGKVLLNASPDCLKILTFGTYWFEFLVPFLFFFLRPRLWLALLLALMHVGFAFSLELGIFPLVGIVTAVILIPSSFWENSFIRERTQNSSAQDVNSNPGPVRPDFALNRIEKIFIILCLIAAFSFNIESWQKSPFLPGFAKHFIKETRINQNWAMFSPRPSQTSGWHVLAARTAKGNYVDLLKGGRPASYKKPVDVSGLYKNCRWRKFFNNTGRRQFSRYRKYYADYLCRDWNSRHPDQIVKNVSIVFFQQRNFGDYIRSNPKKIVLLNSYRCR